jgi:hypothetical protein
MRSGMTIFEENHLPARTTSNEKNMFKILDQYLLFTENMERREWNSHSVNAREADEVYMNFVYVCVLCADSIWQSFQLEIGFQKTTPRALNVDFDLSHTSLSA